MEPGFCSLSLQEGSYKEPTIFVEVEIVPRVLAGHAPKFTTSVVDFNEASRTVAQGDRQMREERRGSTQFPVGDSLPGALGIPRPHLLSEL